MNPSKPVNKLLIIINSISFIGTQAFNVFILIWLQRYLLNRISVEEYSIYPIIVSVMFIIMLLRSLFISGFFRYAMDAYAKNDSEKLQTVVSSSFYLILFCGLIIWSLGLVFAWNINLILNIATHFVWDARIMMALLVSNFVIELITSPLWMGLNIKEKYYIINAVDSGAEILKLTILLLLLFLVSTKVVWIVVATVSSHILGTIVKIFLSRRTFQDLKIKYSSFEWSTAKEMIGFGGWNFLLMFAVTLRNSSDVVILNKFATSFDVACFHLGRLFHKYSVMSWDMMRMSLMPALTALHSLEMETGMRNAYLRGGRYSLWMTLFFAAPCIGFRNEIITLYVGAKFLPAAHVALFLLLSLPIEYGHSMLRLVARAKASLKILAIMVTITQLVNIAMTIYFVSALKLGAVGSAYSTFFTFLFLEPLMIWPIGLKMVNLKLVTFTRETLIPGLLPFLFTIVFCTVIKNYFNFLSVINLLLGVSGGGVLYLLVLIISLRPNDKKDINAGINKIKSKLPRFNKSNA